MKFEYKIVQFRVPELSEAEEKLNELGLQGWELVSHTGKHSMGSTQRILFVLKRRIS